MDRVLGLFSLLLVGLAGAVAWGRQTGTPASILLLTAAAGASDAWRCCGQIAGSGPPSRNGCAQRGIGLRFTRIADAISQYRGQRRAMAPCCALDRSSTAPDRAGLSSRHRHRHRRAVHVLSGVHANRPDRAAAANLARRVRAAAGCHRRAAAGARRLASPKRWRSRR